LISFIATPLFIALTNLDIRVTLQAPCRCGIYTFIGKGHLGKCGEED